MAQISDYLVKINEDVTVNMYNNGFMFCVSGTDHNDSWATAKIVCSTIEEVILLVREAAMLPRN